MAIYWNISDLYPTWHRLLIKNHWTCCGFTPIYSREWEKSAYRPGHSTETVLLYVHTNIVKAVHDDRKTVASVLLDLSAAFDTIDHNMLSRLRKRLGVGGIALKWFKSHLKGRKQSVVIYEIVPSPVDVLYRVPQGSELGPKLFTMHTLPVADISRKYNLEIHLYADDTQIHIRTSDNISEEIAIQHALAIWLYHTSAVKSALAADGKKIILNTSVDISCYAWHGSAISCRFIA